MSRIIAGGLMGLLAAIIISDASATPRKDIAGFWTIDLKSGWNLVAFPVLPDEATPQRVVGDQLGAVRIAWWDRAVRGYRHAEYIPQTGQWSGDLYRLDRGAAYWIYLADEPRSLTVTGHPEEYVKFRWPSLGAGWRFYAPTFGKAQRLEELPPDDDADILLQWDAATNRYETAAAVGGNWSASGFDNFQPDRSYIVHRQERELRSVSGDIYRGERFGGAAGLTDGIQQPPWPVVVGNISTAPICYESGEACSGAMNVRVVRERSQVGAGGSLETNYDIIGDYRVSLADPQPGRFQIALTVGRGEEYLHDGDRVRLVVSSGGAQTQSESFEVPADANFVRDISFPEPMLARETPAAPAQFALGPVFPNPFNDRFQVEVQIPLAGAVKLTIYDLSGRPLKSASLPLGAGRHRLTLNAGDLPAGVYLVTVGAGGARGVAKVAHIK